MILQREQVAVRLSRLSGQLPRRIVRRLRLPRRIPNTVYRSICIAHRTQRLFQRRMAPPVQRLADQQNSPAISQRLPPQQIDRKLQAIENRRAVIPQCLIVNCQRRRAMLEMMLPRAIRPQALNRICRHINLRSKTLQQRRLRIERNHRNPMRNIPHNGLDLGGEVYTVIGVMPPGFSFPRANEMPGSFEFPREAQLWVPLVVPITSAPSEPD